MALHFARWGAVTEFASEPSACRIDRTAGAAPSPAGSALNAAAARSGAASPNAIALDRANRLDPMQQLGTRGSLAE